MPKAPVSEYHDLGGGLYEWSAFDRDSKVDRHTHALAAGDRLVIVDPIPLRKESFDEILAAAALPAGPILLTNGNHARQADQYRRLFKEKVYAAEAAREALRADGLETDGVLGDPGSLPGGLVAIPLLGFAPGETALFLPDNPGGTLLLGDAIINLPEPYAFTPLPAKYCTEPKRTAASLGRLLDFPFTRIAFAHGTPILSGARARLEALLKG